MTVYVPRLTISKGVRRKMHSLPARETWGEASMSLMMALWACEQCDWQIEEAVVITAQREDCEVEPRLVTSILDECERRDGKLASMSGVNRC